MQIKNSKSAYEYLNGRLTADVEEFWAVALTPSKTIIHSTCLFIGTVDACMVHPRDIFRYACLQNASSILIAHNHPSLDVTPSCEDIELTRRIRRLGRLMQIPVIDHLILSPSGYFSFADHKWLSEFRRPLQSSADDPKFV